MATLSPLIGQSVSQRRCWRTFLGWRTMVALLILVVTAYLASTHPEYLLLELISVGFVGSQLFWLNRVTDLGERLVARRLRRSRVSVIVGLVYLFLVAYSFPSTIAQGHTFRIGFEHTPE